ncbi:probable membrane-associated kinase regulator 2 isoform X1 [Dendrobium catenatum]|uniref:probable membrane-associated kinase regulator 2 isoform X1 n=1 Tax=Dendrobium catenatum TaxID=906689 RepID=UPI0010A066F3|nr:probable membrane-associated kinase regulator 2 isoform X1 [Dendrobium catenatum]
MEVFSLLKLRRSGDDPIAPTANACASDICCAAGANHGGGGVMEDEGPFFDLEFSVPVELKMNASSMGHRSSTSSTSLKEEILFNGRLFTLESSSSPSSLFFSPAASEPNSKPHFPASVVKSATKLRIFMFRLNSSNSSSNSASDSIKFIKEEKKLVYKDVILRYISKIKPLYVKVSKLRFSGPLGPNKDGSAAQSAGAKKQSKGKPWSTGNSLSYRLKAVPGRLRKSRSASSAVAYVYPPPMVTPKHDDSLLQQEDGIQSAIAHCKRSFHSEKESGFWAAESPLLRSMSDPGEDRSIGRVRDNSAIN